jgi:hypothetical protein
MKRVRSISVIESNYAHGSGYHDGSVTEQDAIAYLGVFKRLEDVPDRYRAERRAPDLDAEEAWDAFKRDKGVYEYTEHTQKYKYGKAWRQWVEYCDDSGLNPVFASPHDVESFLSAEMEDISTYKTGHDLRFRPLFMWYRWMQWDVDYPHLYNPMVMAVLLGGTTARIWRTRLYDREENPLWVGSDGKVDEASEEPNE